MNKILQEESKSAAAAPGGAVSARSSAAARRGLRPGRCRLPRLPSSAARTERSGAAPASPGSLPALPSSPAPRRLPPRLPRAPLPPLTSPLLLSPQRQPPPPPSPQRPGPAKRPLGGQSRHVSALEHAGPLGPLGAVQGEAARDGASRLALPASLFPPRPSPQVRRHGPAAPRRLPEGTPRGCRGRGAGAGPCRGPRALLGTAGGRRPVRG